MKRLRPFFRYYGSKHRLAPKYPAPRFARLIEPYAGSAQYATLHRELQVELVEADEEIAALWTWLVSADPSEIRRLPTDLVVGSDIRQLPIHPSARVLIRLWQRVGRNDCWTVSKWNGVNSGLWCASTRDAIADQISAIRHWRITHGWAVERMRAGLDESPATWFIDPPYESQPNVYGGAPDFSELANACLGLLEAGHQVIVCEAPHADGTWPTWLPFAPLASNTVGRTKLGGARAQRLELYWAGDDDMTTLAEIRARRARGSVGSAAAAPEKPEPEVSPIEETIAEAREKVDELDQAQADEQEPEKPQAQADEQEPEKPQKRPRGRPRGSKNKAAEAAQQAAETTQQTVAVNPPPPAETPPPADLAELIRQIKALGASKVVVEW